MNYRTTYVRNPGPDDLGKLVNYVAGELVLRGSGLRADQRDLDGFRAAAYNCEMSRQHMFAFEHHHDHEELAQRVRLVFRDQMDGDFLVGVHTDTDTNHVHVAQVGTTEQCYMDTDDIEQLRSAVVDRFHGESIGTGGMA
ncbi:hypothetical protein DMJ13_27550 [halophilic archaeon]|nr:hypothetical protein DMJ13_27550 [halophilic archaeon]